MPIEARIALFWAVVFGFVWYVRRHPESIAARMAFTWHGPFPAVGERKSHYYRRVCLFAFGWFLQFLVMALCGYLWATFDSSAPESTAFQVVFIFALPLGAGMALIAGCLAWLTSIKAATLGPNTVFEERNDVPG